jgi:hypothetical protein
MNLCDVQAQLRDKNPYYVNMLSWKQENGYIKATPRKPLSNLAHNTIKKTFERLGGNYVWHAGNAWFELVLEEKDPCANETASLPGKDELHNGVDGSVFKQIEVQQARLRCAGQQCTEEAKAK